MLRCLFLITMLVNDQAPEWLTAAEQVLELFSRLGKRQPVVEWCLGLEFVQICMDFLEISWKTFDMAGVSIASNLWGPMAPVCILAVSGQPDSKGRQARHVSPSELTNSRPDIWNLQSFLPSNF